MSTGTALHCIVSSAVAGLRPVGRAMSALGQKRTLCVAEKRYYSIT